MMSATTEPYIAAAAVPPAAAAAAAIPPRVLKRLGEGSYGCVVKPVLTCDAGLTRYVPTAGAAIAQHDLDLVSKIMLRDHAITAWANNDVVLALDPTSTFTQPMETKCDVTDTARDVHISALCKNLVPHGVALAQLTMREGVPFLDAAYFAAVPQLRDALQHVLHVAKGMVTMHARGVAHGDIKCDNMMLFRNTLKLIDFDYMFGFDCLPLAVPLRAAVRAAPDPLTAAHMPRAMRVQNDYTPPENALFGNVLFSTPMNTDDEVHLLLLDGLDELQARCRVVVPRRWHTYIDLLHDGAAHDFLVFVVQVLSHNGVAARFQRAFWPHALDVFQFGLVLFRVLRMYTKHPDEALMQELAELACVLTRPNPTRRRSFEFAVAELTRMLRV